MAKKAYIGVNGVARKIKKGYIGVDGVAHKIKKAYIGIGGVARPCWSGGELAYYGAITPLSQVRSKLAAATVGNHALFGGGAYRNSSTYVAGYSDVVDSYDASLTKGTPTALSRPRQQLAATTVGDHALFGGGYGYNKYGIDEVYVSAVTAYNASLSLTTPTELSLARRYLAAASNQNYALFAGGNAKSMATTSIVDAYDTSLTRTTPTELSSGRYSMGATTIGDRILFGGGQRGGGYPYTSDVVDAFDATLVRSTPTTLSLARYGLVATAVEGFALFAAGYDGSGYSRVVDVYDESLVRTTATELSRERFQLAATTVGNCAIFGGGWTQRSSTYLDVVDAYTVA